MRGRSRSHTGRGDDVLYSKAGGLPAFAAETSLSTMVRSRLRADSKIYGVGIHVNFLHWNQLYLNVSSVSVSTFDRMADTLREMACQASDAL
jgi:hypothetical protein